MYHGQDILRAGIVPADLVLQNAQYRPEMAGLQVPRGTFMRILPASTSCAPPTRRAKGVLRAGRQPARAFGVSYMLENRKMMMRLFPDLFGMHQVAPVAHYPDLLLDTLRASAPAGAPDPPWWCSPRHAQQRLF